MVAALMMTADFLSLLPASVILTATYTMTAVVILVSQDAI